MEDDIQSPMRMDNEDLNLISEIKLRESDSKEEQKAQEFVILPLQENSL